ncbi:Uncharacterised protein [Mycobacteroides abscessus subsp. abscessus]|nr:Uncharacterised protein [Mycobacteroides abscessus subsp. abscessus]
MALKGSATTYPPMERFASAGTISDGLITTSSTVRRTRDAVPRITGRNPCARKSSCSTMLWIDHQNGMATAVPARSSRCSMSGATVSADPLV